MDRLGDRRSRRDPALKNPARRRTVPRTLRATRPGWCFIAIILCVGFAALNTGNNLLYLVFALMLAFLVLSGILSESSLRGVAVERRLPREIFAGTANPVLLRIENRKPRVAAFAISIEDRLEFADGAKTDGRVAAGRCFVLRVGPDAAVERSYAWTPARRGEARLASIKISTRFPFGLFVKSIEVEAAENVLVYPAISPVARSEAVAARRARSLDERSGQAQVGDAIGGLREFVRGDSAARVHWRRSVRSGRLVVGERDGDAAAEVEISLPIAAELSEPIFEERIARAASEVVHHLEAGHRVGLRARQTRIAPGDGHAHRRALLGFLARVELHSEEPA